MKNIKSTKKTLILGASGLLGHHLFKLAKVLGHDVTGTFNCANLESSEYIKLDAFNVQELNQLISHIKPELIINTIAFVTVDGCEKDPQRAEYLNNDFVKKIVSSLRLNNLANCKLVQISTDSVYGKLNDGEQIQPWSEESKTRPMSVYAKTKLAGELSALDWKNSLVLRTAFYGINPNSNKSLLYWIIENIKNGKDLEGWENVFFSPVSADLLSKTILDLNECNAKGIFNIGSNDICNKYDFVSYVCKKLNLPAKINKTSMTIDNPIRPFYSALSSSKLAKLLNWNIQWKEDLDNYIDKYLRYKS